jgi:hypothetical protein
VYIFVRQYYLSCGGLDPETQDVLVGIQLEKEKVKTTKSFTAIEELLLQTVVLQFSLKIHQLSINLSSQKKEQSFLDLISMCIEFLKERSYFGLFFKMKSILPEFTGFKQVGALYYEIKGILCIFLFSILRKVPLCSFRKCFGG